ncbi:MAG: type II toxin-antitoxin system CcdA family antitoxin [Thiovulaceae bacterium]|nr:type II toxin-antitoxin system CcdA family antitoxin [Sulfurimonadaceae bacterium]
MTKKMTNTMEDELIEELSQTALQLGKKKAQLVREALQSYLPSAKKKILEEAWLKDNAEAIQAQNAHVEKYGIFGEEYRSF